MLEYLNAGKKENDDISADPSPAGFATQPEASRDQIIDLLQDTQSSEAGVQNRRRGEVVARRRWMKSPAKLEPGGAQELASVTDVGFESGCEEFDD